MNTFKQKALTAAVLSGLGLAAGTAQAVYLDHNGLGQVLVYPYYTVQSAGGNSFNTYMSVVNTTNRAKVVKVRFREGKTSTEVLDFNLYLSPNDVWTAGIVPADATATSAARLFTTDVSCTNPAIPGTGIDFRNFLYLAGSDSTVTSTALERTREGYFEVIEMGTLTGVAAANVTHGVTGVPANCTAVRGPAVTLLTVESPTGGLMGGATLINVNTGADFTYNADALAEFRTAPFYTDIANDAPNLSSADPTSVVVNTGVLDAAGVPAGPTVYRSDFAVVSTTPAGARAVASVYMHTAILNEYVLDNATQSSTDWVITQPVKRFFVDNVTARQPYSNVLVAAGACENIDFTFFNREESGAAAAGVDFSPAPPTGSGATLCWESTVLSIRNGATHLPAATASTVLGSLNLRNVDINTTYQNGWAALTFNGIGASAQGMGNTATSDDATFGAAAITVIPNVVSTFFGLPVTGFMVRTFRNGALTCTTGTCSGNYGGLFLHAYRTRIAL